MFHYHNFKIKNRFCYLYVHFQNSQKMYLLSISDNIRNMNEKLKQELMQLDGEIEHSQVVNYRTRSYYGSQASLRSGPR